MATEVQLLEVMLLMRLTPRGGLFFVVLPCTLQLFSICSIGVLFVVLISGPQTAIVVFVSLVFLRGCLLLSFSSASLWFSSASPVFLLCLPCFSSAHPLLPLWLFCFSSASPVLLLCLVCFSSVSLVSVLHLLCVSCCVLISLLLLLSCSCVCPAVRFVCLFSFSSISHVSPIFP